MRRGRQRATHIRAGRAVLSCQYEAIESTSRAALIIIVRNNRVFNQLRDTGRVTLRATDERKVPVVVRVRRPEGDVREIETRPESFQLP